MAITVTNINTAGAVVTLGGTVNAVDTDGFYIGTTSGVDVGCTSGGVTVAYSFETRDIYCDQITAPVETAIINETATVKFDMLESDADNLAIAIQQCATTTDVGVANKIGVGGIIVVNFTPLQLVIKNNDDASLETTWTFFKTLSGGMETNFERDNPTGVTVTFTAYADTSHASGHQLFSVNEALT